MDNFFNIENFIFYITFFIQFCCCIGIIFWIYIYDNSIFKIFFISIILILFMILTYFIYLHTINI